MFYEILSIKGHVTTDTWHLTYDTWHVTHAMWHMTCYSWWGWTISQILCSPALTVWARQSLEDSEQKDDWINQWANYKGVYRTASGTWHFDILFTSLHVSQAMSHISRLICHITCVTCHMSYVACHMLRVTCHIFLQDLLQDRARDLTFWYIVHLPPCVTSHVSHITIHTSHNMCHMSHVTCCVSHVACHMSHFFLQDQSPHFICHMPHATCNMSHVTCCKSHDTCHVSHFTCHMLHIPYIIMYSKDMFSWTKMTRGIWCHIWIEKNSFTKLVPLSHGVAMSVCGDVCLRHRVHIC